MAGRQTSFEDAVVALRSIGEPTRLRILSLLAVSEVTVKDLTEILAQSQPRVSRHLKLLTEAELIERLPEGAWAYYRLADTGSGPAMVAAVLNELAADDPVLEADRRRLAAIKEAHAAIAQRYFAENAASWDRAAR